VPVIDEDLENGWSLLATARGVGLAVRVLILTAPLMALGATSAAGHTNPAITLAVLGATMFCILRPDSHLGLLVVLLIGGQWLANVHTPTTPWSLATAAALAVFHAALAAASAIPPAAAWTTAMFVRWTRRTSTVVAASGATWTMLTLIDNVDLAGNPALLTISLLVIAGGGLWARTGTLGAHGHRSTAR
jgi:hypothetical protein